MRLQPGVITTTKAAKIAGTTKGAIYARIKSGELKARRVDCASMPKGQRMSGTSYRWVVQESAVLKRHKGSRFVPTIALAGGHLQSLAPFKQSVNGIDAMVGRLASALPDMTGAGLIELAKDLRKL